MPRPGRGAVKARLAEILRVDHAGELGPCTSIAASGRCSPRPAASERISGQLADMEAHEAEHLARFDALLNDRQVRPTLMAPLWRAAGFALGAGTALLGEKAAHACTEAVENVIEDHYAGQIAELAHARAGTGRRAFQVPRRGAGPPRPGGGRGRPRSPGLRLLSAVIRAGCKAAIKISEKV
jgi:ubiquinone biosynthesis monooxygenase Coq7